MACWRREALVHTAGQGLAPGASCGLSAPLAASSGGHGTERVSSTFGWYREALVHVPWHREVSVHIPVARRGPRTRFALWTKASPYHGGLAPRGPCPRSDAASFRQKSCHDLTQLDMRSKPLSPPRAIYLRIHRLFKSPENFFLKSSKRTGHFLLAKEQVKRHFEQRLSDFCKIRDRQVKASEHHF